MTDTIAIAISGGIDSLVAAYLLKEQGLDVFGIHFRTGYEKKRPAGKETLEACCRQLSLPLYVIDLQTAFKREVVDYFTAAYKIGETPNPCLVCNSKIKFGLLLEQARQLGAGRLATGHYARVEKEGERHYRLRKGLDEKKDQSYFLAYLNKKQLARACFPLGHLSKDRVRDLAQKKGLHPMAQEESQDVCFIHGRSYADFLLQNGQIDSRAGDIVDTAGQKVGNHDGLHQFTVGQRRGINCPASQAYYVVRIDINNNRLVVGFKDELYSRSCRVRDINWIGGTLQKSMEIDVRIRYRHRAVTAVVTPIGDHCADVLFKEPQAAVTPGQGAVFYKEDEVLGAGWIKKGCLK